MEINLTLVVQVINFSIAWALLRILYFKPAIEYIAYKKKEYTDLVDALSDWQKKITIKEHEKSQMWKDFKAFSKAHGPSIVTMKVPFKYSHPIAPHIDQKHIKELIEEAAEFIIEGVSHVEV